MKVSATLCSCNRLNSLCCGIRGDVIHSSIVADEGGATTVLTLWRTGFGAVEGRVAIKGSGPRPLCLRIQSARMPRLAADPRDVVNEAIHMWIAQGGRVRYTERESA